MLSSPIRSMIIGSSFSCSVEIQHWRWKYSLGFNLPAVGNRPFLHGVVHAVQQERHPAAVAFQKRQFQFRMTLADTAADRIGHGDHVFQRMRNHVAQQQIVAETVADLRHLSGGRGGVKSHRNTQFLQTRPDCVEIARMPGHVAQWLRPGEDAHEAKFTHGPLGLL